MNFAVTYSLSEPNPSACDLCLCCSVCHSSCGCVGDILSPRGMFHFLAKDIPDTFEQIENYVDMKISEEKAEEAEDSEVTLESESDVEDGEESLGSELEDLISLSVY